MLIWIFFLLYQGEGHEKFSLFKLLAYLLIGSGILIFNKVFDFKKSEKKLDESKVDQSHNFCKDEFTIQDV